MWADASLQSVAPHIPTSAAIAAVRCATVGMPLEETACSPFTRGRWLFSHNGRIDRSVLPTSAWRAADSVCDSAILAAWLLDDPDELAQRICKLGAADPKARLNVLLADGEQVLATVWGDTLAVRVDDSGVVVASEPYDDDAGWGEIPDRTLLTVSSDGVSLTDLEPM
jgi:glutamine amidotransferase